MIEQTAKGAETMIYNSIEELIGKTPLLRLNKIENNNDVKSSIYAKVEYFNPAGSVKDRVALSMINEAEQSGRLKAGGTIIEPTSGNTGVGVSMIAAARGYRAIIIMPETMSIERRQLMSAYGAEVILTAGALGMQGTVDKAEELEKEIDGAIIAGQFINPANPKIHYETTGEEILADLDGKVDIFVAGIGTGGTITGVGTLLKERNPAVKIIAVEPESSPLLSTGKAGPHKIAGIGANFVPEVLNTEIYDEIITISNEDAIENAKIVAKTEGLLVGISAGASLAAGIQLAKRAENVGKNIVVLLPDTGERYLSTGIFG